MTDSFGFPALVRWCCIVASRPLRRPTVFRGITFWLAVAIGWTVYLFLRRSMPPATTDVPPVTTDEPPAARQSALSSQCMMPATLASVPFSRISFSPAYSSPPGCRPT
jgi:hypothetical protein